MRVSQIVLFAFLAFPIDVALAASAKSHPAPIKREMSGLFSVTSELLPIVINKAEFENPKNETKIVSQMERLRDLTKVMSTQSGRFSDSDPSVKFLSERFAEDIDYSIQMWSSGDRIVPRRLLRNVTDYCISCHTRTAKGAHFHTAIQPASFKTLPLSVRAEYFAATRQYEEALKLYEKILANSALARLDPMAWNETVQKMLAISVRVQKDPSVTYELISSLLDKTDSVPPGMIAKVTEWRKSAKAWVAERSTIGVAPEQGYGIVVRLIDEGDSLSNGNPGAGMVQYLRASSTLHEILSRVKSGSKYQELLWLAGRSAAALKELNLWTMQDAYFEACLRIGGSPIFHDKCYKGYEDSVTAAYGANSVANLPAHMRQRLENLRKLP